VRVPSAPVAPHSPLIGLLVVQHKFIAWVFSVFLYAITRLRKFGLQNGPGCFTEAARVELVAPPRGSKTIEDCEARGSFPAGCV